MARKKPARRRRRSTTKGQFRKTARRAYSARRPNPARRRRKRRSNPVGDIIQQALIAGAFGAGAAGLVEYLKGVRIKDMATSGKSWVPDFAVQGYGEGASLAGLGVLVGALMDMGKGQIKRNAKNAASGIVAVGAAKMLTEFMRVRALQQPTAGLYRAPASAAINAPTVAAQSGLGALYEGALPF